MNQFKRAQVIILPTKDKSLLYLSNDELCKTSTPLSTISINRYLENQHLYIISDKDEIKEDDWIYCDYSNTIHQDYQMSKKECCKKIIATTDTSLRIYSPCIQCDGTGETVFSGTYTTQKKCNLCSQLKYPNTKSLSQPSQQFIEKYIEEYNKGNVIEDVLVEYEQKYETIHKGQVGFPEDNISWWVDKLKVNPKDNTITIKKLKESWNKEEVIEILYKYGLNLIHQIENKSLEEQIDIKEWIKQNL